MLNSVNNNPLLIFMLVVGVRTCLKLYPPTVPVFGSFTVGVKTCLVLYLRTVHVSCVLSRIYCRCENMYYLLYPPTVFTVAIGVRTCNVAHPSQLML